MTFLEFVVSKVLGTTGNYRTCPFCHHRNKSFVVKPPDKAGIERWKCWRCPEWGDMSDFIKLHLGVKDYGVRLRMIAEYRTEYDALPADRRVSPTYSSSRGVQAEMRVAIECAWGELTGQERKAMADASDVAMYLDDALMGYELAFQVLYLSLTDDQRTAFKSACLIADRFNVYVLGLAIYCQEFEEWVRETDCRYVIECNSTDDYHREGCDDAGCDMKACRAARTLSPLTLEALVARWALAEKEREKQMRENATNKREEQRRENAAKRREEQRLEKAAMREAVELAFGKLTLQERQTMLDLRHVLWLLDRPIPKGSPWGTGGFLELSPDQKTTYTDAIFIQIKLYVHMSDLSDYCWEFGAKA